MIKVCGFNNKFQLGEDSNNKDSLSNPVVNPPCNFKIDISSLLSISFYYFQTVWITRDRRAFAIGCNTKSQIIDSLPHETFQKEREIKIQDEEGNQCEFVSVVCGESYTLYRVLVNSDLKQSKLVYQYEDCPKSIFLNINGREPLAIFGGDINSAIIDSEGAILLITKSIYDNPNKIIEPIFLPNNEKTVSVACCNQFIIALSATGHVYESPVEPNRPSQIIFKPVDELFDKKISQISGTFEHCFAVCKDGRVFGRGSNKFGQLALGKGIEKVDIFTEIQSLSKYEVKNASAGVSHSLFQTADGKVLACGNNFIGQLPLSSCLKKKMVTSPHETVISGGATFCVAGGGETAVFIDEQPPLNTPNLKVTKDHRRQSKMKIKPRDTHDVKNDEESKSDDESSKKIEMSSSRSTEQKSDNESKKDDDENKSDTESKKDDDENKSDTESKKDDDENKSDTESKKDDDENKSDTESKKDDESNSESDSKSETESKKDDESKSESDSKSDTESKKDDESNSEKESKKDDDSNSDTESKKEDDSKSEHEQKSENDSESKRDEDSEPKSDEKQSKKSSSSSSSDSESKSDTESKQDHKEELSKPPIETRSINNNDNNKAAAEEDQHKNEIIESLKRENEELRRKIEALENSEPKSDTTNSCIEILDTDSIQNLRTIDEISSGSGGKVVEVVKEEKFALKVMSGSTKVSNDQIRTQYLAEHEKLNSHKHPNIIRTYGIHLGDEKSPLSILLEFCQHDLNSAIKTCNLSNEMIVKYVYQIVEGMKFAHSQGFVHRDLKPSNILITKDGIIKISEFGIPTLMSTEEQSTILSAASQKFMAPELLNEEDYNEKADVYSFGVVLFFMISGGQMPKITIIQMGNGKKAPIPDTFTQFASDLINKCWEVNPDNRPSFVEILDLLDHNNYALIELSNDEVDDIRKFVAQHKKRIPQY